MDKVSVFHLEAFQIKCRVNIETHIQQQTVHRGVAS